MLKFRLISLPTFILIGVILLSACGANEPDLTPTLTFAPDEIRTQAVGTFSMDLTSTAFAAPTNTPAATATPLATLTPLATIAALGTAPLATSSCYGLAFVSDVNIPDNTPVDPGKGFTK